MGAYSHLYTTKRTRHKEMAIRQKRGRNGKELSLIARVCSITSAQTVTSSLALSCSRILRKQKSLRPIEEEWVMVVVMCAMINVVAKCKLWRGIRHQTKNEKRNKTNPSSKVSLTKALALLPLE